jgi:hypothetical protein
MLSGLPLIRQLVPAYQSLQCGESGDEQRSSGWNLHHRVPDRHPRLRQPAASQARARFVTIAEVVRPSGSGVSIHGRGKFRTADRSRKRKAAGDGKQLQGLLHGQHLVNAQDLHALASQGQRDADGGRCAVGLLVA